MDRQEVLTRGEDQGWRQELLTTWGYAHAVGSHAHDAGFCTHPPWITPSHCGVPCPSTLVHPHIVGFAALAVQFCAH